MWPDLIQKAKDGGLDVIQTYVFWNGHEPSPGKVIQKLNLTFSFLHIYIYINAMKRESPFLTKRKDAHWKGKLMNFFLRKFVQMIYIMNRSLPPNFIKKFNLELG